MSYEALRSLTIDGEILDLGGSRKSGYHELIGGTHTFRVVNIDSEYGYDLKFDIEKPFPLDSNAFDGVLLVNALEHVFDYRTTLSESWRVLKSGGPVVIVVPFLMPVHPCPHDYWRYTGEALQKILDQAHFKEVSVTAIGRGPFTAAAHMRFNVYKIGLLRTLTYFIAGLLDWIVMKIKKDSYGPTAYPLGYVAVAKK
jgi:SAM-dependent methyltransferase